METKKILESKKTERWLLVGIVVTFIVSLFLASINPNNISNAPDVNDISNYEVREIAVASSSYSVLIADTQEKRMTGLSYRTALPENIDGMLFIFDTPGNHNIWMKDMNLTLDIHWLNENFNIIHTESNISPETYPESFTSTSPALYVLEIVK